MTTLTKIIVSQLLVIIVITGAMLFMSDGIAQYSPSVPSTYNQSLIKIQNISDTINRAAQNASQKLRIDSSGNDPARSIDFLGFFFNAGYTAANAIKAGVESLRVFIDITVTETPLGSGDGAFGALVISVLGVGVVIILVVYLILHFVIKSDRL